MRFFKVIFSGMIACLFSSCSSTNSAQGSSSPAVASVSQGKWESLERRIANSVEQKRKTHGFAPMTYHSGMASLARNHSEMMKKKFLKTGQRVLSHDGFNRRGNVILLDYAMFRAAENVAYIWGENGDPEKRFSHNWINSPKHKKNILKKWNYTGVGIAVCPDGTIFATQLFGLKTDFTF